MLQRYTLLSLLLCSALLLATSARGENIVFPDDAGLVDVVKEYGAKGDGKTDDTEAIQNAMASGLKNGNKRLYFRNGTYLISEPLGLFNAKAHSDTRFMSVQGQSEAGTVFKLKDNAERFQDPDKPGIVWSFYDGQSTGDAMHSYGRNFTVDVGTGNPGAVGVRYMTNNVGTIEHVTIKSSDPEKVGKIGLDLTQSQNGPGLIKHITVDGFDYGMASANSFSLVFEHINLRHQRVAGYDNKFSRVTMRKLISDNTVPAVINGNNGHLTLIDADLTGGAADQTAIITKDAKVYFRDIKQSGYGHILQTADGKTLDGETLEEWHGLKGYALFDAAPLESLRLPVEETPEVPWEEDLSKWIKIDNSGGKDVTQALQKAIDEGVAAGKTTIYLPRKGKSLITGPIRVHGSINRIIGMADLIDVADPNGAFKGDDAPAVFTFENLDSDVMIVEQFFLIGGWNVPGYVTMFENKSKATIVLKSVGVGGTTKKPNPGGTWFIEDMSPSRQSTLEIGKGETVWARQYNPETPEIEMIHVDGGQLWLLGLKTEGRATHLHAENGAKVEVLGGVSYQSWGKQPLDPPAFIIDNSDVSITTGFYHHETPFATIVEETRDGKTRSLKRDELVGYHLPLYRSTTGKVAAGDQDTRYDVGITRDAKGNVTYSLPDRWAGSDKGSDAGSVLSAGEQPIWSLEQVWPADPMQAANYRPMVWGGDQWVAPSDGHGGQPQAKRTPEQVTLTTRAPHGEPPHLRTASLSFIVPEAGRYHLAGKAASQMWDGKNDTTLLILHRSGDEVRELTSLKLADGKSAGLDEVTFEAKAGDRISLVPQIDGMFAGGNLLLSDLAAVQMRE